MLWSRKRKRKKEVVQDPLTVMCSILAQVQEGAEAERRQSAKFANMLMAAVMTREYANYRQMAGNVPDVDPVPIPDHGNGSDNIPRDVGERLAFLRATEQQVLERQKQLQEMEANLIDPGVGE